MGCNADLETGGKDRLAGWCGNFTGILDIRADEHNSPSVSAFTLGACQEGSAFDNDIA